MKAMFIAYNQAFNEEIVQTLQECGQKGFTRWHDIEGRGHFNGQPRLGSHAWPELNQGVLAVMPDEVVDKVLAALKAKDEAAPELGLRAFVWNVEKYY